MIKYFFFISLSLIFCNSIYASDIEIIELHTKKSLDQYISSQTEVSWITDDQTNPYTQLFSYSKCSKLFDIFDRIQIRSGNFHTPGNFLLKFLALAENTKIMSKFGTMIYVSGSKSDN